VFKTPQERDDKALASYREAQEKHPNTGAAILAKLGEAGVLLDKREWDKAIEAYDAVLKTQLASADPDVKGRAIEGIGFAKEGKGDVDGATAEFRRLETIDAKGYKELSQLHQARLLLAKNTDDDRAKAKDLLKAAHDKLKEPALDKKPMPYLERSVEQALKTLDPSLVPDRDSMNSVRGGQMSQEELQQRLRKIQEELGKKKDADPH
jgi:tetratricopeptide (TPR) repeat protein